MLEEKHRESGKVSLSRSLSRICCERIAVDAELVEPAWRLLAAERVGFHQARAAQWVRAAGATYADYVALRHD